jgi:hypothetical protein
MTYIHAQGKMPIFFVKCALYIRLKSLHQDGTIQETTARLCTTSVHTSAKNRKYREYEKKVYMPKKTPLKPMLEVVQS